MTDNYDYYILAGGFDVILTLPESGNSFPNGATLTLTADVGVSTGGDTCHLDLTRGNPWAVSLRDDNQIFDTFHFNLAAEPQEIRVLFHNGFATLYLDGYWIYTFYFIPTYKDSVQVSLSASTPITFTRTLKRELSDWRDAIYVDLEQTGQNAISSIIQQRPVIVQARYDGAILFFYEKDSRPRVDLDFIRSHRVTDAYSQNAASDGIVYYSDTDAIFSEQAAEQIGFVTRIYRLPDLDTGAIQAAQVMQKHALQEGCQHNVVSRPNLELEIEDCANVVETNHPKHEFIVESIDYALQGGQYTMTTRGRDLNAESA